MPSLASLWLPILASAAAVFVVSSIIHMVLKYHNPDYRKLPNEDDVRAVLNKGGAGPGQYVVPQCLDPKAAAGEDAQRRFKEGPVGVLWLQQPGPPAMGGLLLRWFIYCIVIGVLSAYVGSIVVAKGAAFMTVFRVIGTVAFLGYFGGKWSDTIWKGKPAACSIKDTIDGLLYGLTTGAVFAAFWPAA